MSQPVSIAKRAAQILLGVALGSAATEAAFWARDGGAFPHLNLYNSDDQLGVRLMPNERTRIQLHDNPVAPLTTNSQGYRGPEWPAPGANEILIVGDSQIFGLGVEDHETMGAALAEATGRTVLNGGVPTYGPEEYLAVADEIMSARPVTDLVVVMNFANDPFEVGQPNTQRHKVWDGWAVRVETAPVSVTYFPGRDWIYRKSHAFYAARRLWWSGESDAVELPSEGSWGQLVKFVERDDALDEQPQQQIIAPIQAIQQTSEVAHQPQQTAAKQRAISASRDDVDELLRPFRATKLFPIYLELIEEEAPQLGANPRDIVGRIAMEAVRPIDRVASRLRSGVENETVMLERLRKWAHTHPRDERAKRITTFLAERAAAVERADQLAKLGGEVVLSNKASSPMSPFVRRATQLAKRHGARLTLVALPVDIQVDAGEWAKYDAEPQPMEETEQLLSDLVLSTRQSGVSAVNLLEPLRAAQPGAFLDGDLHMTPKGQRASALAIAASLSHTPPLAIPDPSLAPGRSIMPTAVEWKSVAENLVRGSSRNHCQTKRIREWLQIRCIQDHDNDVWPTGVRFLDGPLETVAWEEPSMERVYYEDRPRRASKVIQLRTPLLQGVGLSADFEWSDGRVQRLTVKWEDATPNLSFMAVKRTEQAVTKGIVGFYDRHCSGTGPELRRCLADRRQAPPACVEGEGNAGSSLHCYPLCSDDVPCDTGICTDWNGSGVCL